MHMQKRHRWLMGLMAMGIMAVAVGMASSVQAQTTSTGPYYATPSWDQTLPAATRFVILSNFNGEAVLDRNTGLVWEKSPGSDGQRWSNARLSCMNKVIGGQKSWRLPAIAELASLVDPTQSNPSLPPGHPFTNVLSAFYWSASTDAGNPTEVWGVGFGRGDVDNGSKTTSIRAWCVRGGSNADAY